MEWVDLRKLNWTVWGIITDNAAIRLDVVGIRRRGVCSKRNWTLPFPSRVEKQAEPLGGRNQTTAKRLLKFNAGGRQSRWPVAEACVFEEFQSAARLQ